MWNAITLRCPWCGERFEARVDPGDGTADYIEDCPVCCRPITMRLDQEGDALRLSGDRDD